jgi:hypothetical protein
MNRTIASALFAIVTAAAATTALADDITIESQPFASAITRAQVQDELKQFRQSGVNPWARNFDPLAGFEAARTRAQVVSDFVQTREETSALTSEDSGSAWLSGRAPVAAPVLAGQPVNAQ